MSKEELFLNIITNLVLEYRLSIETVCKVFDVDKDNIYSRLIEQYNNNYVMKEALMYVFDHETKIPELIDQKKAKSKALFFIYKLQTSKTPQEKSELVKSISDISEINKIRDKRRDQITEEDISKIIHYRYKYALSRKYITETFEVSDSTIRYWESKLDDDTKNRLKELNNYNETVKYHDIKARKR